MALRLLLLLCTVLGNYKFCEAVRLVLAMQADQAM